MKKKICFKKFIVNSMLNELVKYIHVVGLYLIVNISIKHIMGS